MNREFLAELIVRRKFRQKEKIELPDKFWNLPKYKTEYQLQIRAAQKLLNIYDIDDIMTVIAENVWIYSLNLKRIPEMIDSKIIDRQNTKFIPSKNKEIKFRKENKDNNG